MVDFPKELLKNFVTEYEEGEPCRYPLYDLLYHMAKKCVDCCDDETAGLSAGSTAGLANQAGSQPVTLSNDGQPVSQPGNSTTSTSKDNHPVSLSSQPVNLGGQPVTMAGDQPVGVATTSGITEITTTETIRDTFFGLSTSETGSWSIKIAEPDTYIAQFNFLATVTPTIPLDKSYSNFWLMSNNARTFVMIFYTSDDNKLYFPVTISSGFYLHSSGVVNTTISKIEILAQDILKVNSDRVTGLDFSVSAKTIIDTVKPGYIRASSTSLTIPCQVGIAPVKDEKVREFDVPDDKQKFVDFRFVATYSPAAVGKFFTNREYFTARLANLPVEISYIPGEENTLLFHTSGYFRTTNLKLGLFFNSQYALKELSGSVSLTGTPILTFK